MRRRRRRAWAATATAIVAASLVTAAPAAPAASGRVVDRIAGADRYDTAAQIASRSFPGVAETVYLARGDVFADALVAGTLTDGPVLLVPSCGAVPPVVAEQIARLDPDAVVALGGAAAVCDDLLGAAAAGRARDRVAGSSRYTTAVAISQREFPGTVDEVYLASGNDSPDAVAGGALTRGPILLVPPSGTPPPEVVAEIARLSPQKIVVLGGTAAVSDGTVAAAGGGRPTMRLAGTDRYATAARIAEYEFGPASPGGAHGNVAYLARGDVFADAVAAGSLRDGPVLLVPRCGGLPDAVVDAIGTLRPTVLVALGGAAAVCDDLLDAAAAEQLPDVVIPDTTVVLDAAARDALLSEEAGGLLVFAADAAPPLTAGDVLVSYEVPGVAPQGLLRRVLSVQRAGDTVRVATEPAALTDAIHAGALDFSVPLTRADLLSESGPVAGRQRMAAVDLIDIDEAREMVLYEGEGGGASGSVLANGSFRYNAAFDVELSIAGLQVEYFKTSLTIDESIGLGLTVTGAATWTSKPITLWEGEFRCFWTAVGWIPVSLCPYVTLTLSADGSVEAEVTMGVTQSATAEFGAEYVGEQWRKLNGYDHDHHYAPPSLTANGDVKATVRGELGLEVYDLAGPYVYGDLFVRGEAAVVDDLLCWGVYGGIAAGFGVGADDDVFGELDLPEFELVSTEFLLVEDPVPHEPCERRTREGNSWYGTIVFEEHYSRYDSMPGSTGGQFRNETEDRRYVVALTGRLGDHPFLVEADFLSVEHDYHYLRNRDDAVDSPPGCYDEEQFSATGNVTDNEVVAIHPSADAAVPEFAYAGGAYEFAGVIRSTCEPAYADSFTTSDWFDAGLSYTPVITPVAGGRRICDTMSETTTFDDHGLVVTTEVTATFELADGTATPNCP